MVFKQCTSNPWAAFAENHEKSEHVKGKIKSITDFGIFIELDGGIDGLIYLSDIAWNEADAQDTLRKYQKGDELEAIILTIDVERERIALGLKQLEEDPLSHYMTEHEKGASVSGTGSEVDQKQAMVDLADGIKGVLRAADISSDKIDDVRTKFQVGDVVEAKIAGVDRKIHAVILTMKAKEAKAAAPKKAAAKAAAAPKSSGGSATSKKKPESSLKTTFGDLFKDHINGSNGDDKDGDTK